MAGSCACRKESQRHARHGWRMRWRGAGDDPDAGGDADLGRLWGYRHEERIRWPRHAGAGGVEAEPALGALVGARRPQTHLPPAAEAVRGNAEVEYASVR